MIPPAAPSPPAADAVAVTQRLTRWRPWRRRACCWWSTGSWTAPWRPVGRCWAAAAAAVGRLQLALPRCGARCRRPWRTATTACGSLRWLPGCCGAAVQRSDGHGGSSGGPAAGGRGRRRAAVGYLVAAAVRIARNPNCDELVRPPCCERAHLLNRHCSGRCSGKHRHQNTALQRLLQSCGSRQDETCNLECSLEAPCPTCFCCGSWQPSILKTASSRGMPTRSARAVTHMLLPESATAQFSIIMSRWSSSRPSCRLHLKRPQCRLLTRPLAASCGNWCSAWRRSRRS